MAVRASTQLQAAPAKNMAKLKPEISDQIWNAMITMALKYQRKVGRFRNARYERKFVLLVVNICEMSSTLVELQAICPRPGRSRRLHEIERAVIGEFTKIHGKTYLD